MIDSHCWIPACASLDSGTLDSSRACSEAVSEPCTRASFYGFKRFVICDDLHRPSICKMVKLFSTKSYGKGLFLDLRVVLIIPVHKKGDINNCANYRPISLLSSLCKPLEIHISRHMNIHFARHNLFHTNQSGFRSQHSCQTALIRANEFWLKDSLFFPHS